MRKRVMQLLACPACKEHDLRLHVFSEDSEHVIDGAIRCAGCACVYLVAGGVPRMLPPDLYENAAFVAAHRDALLALGYSPPAEFINTFKQLKQDTSNVYGFEWTHWDRFGWEPGAGPLESERGVFHHKSLLSADEIRGKVLLDGGCGNGRYLFTAAQYAADVVGLDLSAAVDSAFANTRHLPAAHVVQGDLMNPPVRPGVVDNVFSIGVLMITGDARRATEALAALVKPGGTITVHVYAAGFPVWQVNDTIVRKLTTRLSVPANLKLAKVMTTAARWLVKRRWLGYSSLLLRVWPEDAVNFDWYATPKQTYHTYPEVIGWFGGLGYEVLATHQRPPLPRHATVKQRLSYWVWREHMITVRARKPALGHAAAANKPAPEEPRQAL